MAHATVPTAPLLLTYYAELMKPGNAYNLPPALVLPITPAFLVIGQVQYLGLNLTKLLSTYLHERLRTISNQQRRDRLSPATLKKLYSPIGRPFYTRGSYSSRLRHVRRAHDL